MAPWSKTTFAILQPQSKLKVSEWAESGRVVARGTSPEPGPWRNDRNPILIDPMDSFSDPTVETIVMMMSSQVGKTEMLLNVMGFFSGHDPSPQLIVQPTDKMAEAFSKERVVPMFNESPGLAALIDGRDDGTGKNGKRKTTNTILEKHYPGGFLAFAGSNSPAQLASRPIRVVLLDEVDKYKDNREGSPIKQAIQRAQNFYNRKIGIVSTPTIKGASNIEEWFKKSDQRFCWVPCYKCGEFQVLEWENVKWDKDADGRYLPETAALYCVKCGAKIRERQRNEMVSRGEWRPKKPGRKIRGYHANALYSSWVKITDLADEWVEIVRNKYKGQKEFYNLKLGKPFKEYKKVRVEDSILALRDKRPAGLVPGGDQVYCITAAVDTQDNGFWYEIRAWGKGFALESWQIAEGFIYADWDDYGPREELENRAHQYHPAFDPIRELLFERKYFDPDGREYKVILAGIDAMGHKTSEVYDFCRAHVGKIFPIQGMRNRSNRPFKYTRIDTYPGTNKIIPGGVHLLQLDVNNYKDELSSKLQVAAVDPGAWHLSADTTRDWAGHLCAEYLDEKNNRWECLEGKDNHGWDCSVYNLALADILQIKIASQAKPKKEGESNGKKREKKQRQQQKQPKPRRW